MELLERLAEWGCDVEGAMDRFLDDKELYASCLAALCEDPAFDKLGQELRAQSVQEAFDTAHSLKGVIANLGLDPLLAHIVRLVEPLRKGSAENLLPFYEALLSSKDMLAAILAECGL
ncbi:MAG: Hpt domain-containing protein [Roseburia sp.]